MSSAQYVWELSRTLLNDRDGIVAFVRCFMDESGTHAGSPVLTVAAAWARPSVWKKWTKDWNAAKRPIRVCHAVDCHNRAGEYAGWSKSERNAHVKRILPVIAKHSIHGRIAGLHVAAYEVSLADRPDVMGVFGDPYVACFQWVVSAVCEAVRDEGHSRIAFVHEVNGQQSAAFRAFESVRRRNPDLDLALAFGPKDSVVPLQCADTLAYEGNHRLRDVDAPVRKPLEVMDPTATAIGYVEYDRKSMPEFTAEMCRILDAMKAKGLTAVDD